VIVDKRSAIVKGLHDITLVRRIATYP